MFKKVLEHKITFIAAAIIIIIVAVGAAYFLLSPQKHTFTNVTAQTMTIRQVISADGTVDSDQHVSLSFPKGGQVTKVNVKVGDAVHAGEILVAVDPKQLSASLAAAKADVLSAQANLTALGKGATSQTLAVYNQNVSTTKLSLATAIRDSYLKIQDALLNKISSLFDNNSSANPTLIIPTDSFQTTNNTNLARVHMSDRMTDWNALIQDNPTNDQVISETATDIAAAKAFFNTLSYEVNRLTIGNSGMTQSAINAVVATANGAATEANAAETEFNAALQAYKTTTDQLAVIQASSTPEALQIAGAILTKAQANVASIQSQITDTVLTAPFDGIVASVNPKVGDDFPAATPAVDVISPGAYKIDILVPENEVAAVSVGDQADIHFNAYGADLTATGTVASIDLSETVINRVGAYKVTIYLNNSDARLRTGMTATVDINGLSAENAVAIPVSAIIKKADGAYVLLADGKGSYVEHKISTGISDGDWIEVKSGINVGDLVATFGGVESTN